jgi:uncharacterized protein (DUF1330 family)
MAVYAIFNYDVADGDGYASYQKQAGASFAGRTFKVLALDPATTRVEGERSGMQTVILEFDTKKHSTTGTTRPSTRRRWVPDWRRRPTVLDCWSPAARPRSRQMREQP